MAIFGYVVYMIVVGWISLITLAVFSWSSAKRWDGERTAVIMVFLLVWTGAVHWWPFTVTVS